MFVSCTSLQKVYENLSKIVALNAFVSLASAKVGQDFILTKDLLGKFKEKFIFGGFFGKYKVEMIVEGCKIQTLEGKLERKKGEDGGTGGSAAIAAERTRGLRRRKGGA